MIVHKILLFASGYKSNRSANGICARNLVRELVKQGHEVFVIAVPYEGECCMDEMDGAKVWFEPPEFYVGVFDYLLQHHSGLLLRFAYVLFNSVRILFVGGLYPNESPFRVKRLKKRAVSIIEEYNIDTIIGTCNPYDGIPASIYLKRRYKDKLRVITYHFDLLSMPNNKSRLAVLYKKWKFKKAFDKELSIVDHVFLPETANGLYNNSKISLLGFPVYKKIDDVKEIDFLFPEDAVNIVYIGSLDSRNRSPFKAIEYVEKLNDYHNKKYILHLWGSLSDSETCKLIENKTDSICYHGLIDNSFVNSVMMNSDYLLNISNSILYKFIPSKIFSMFATGKPIINIVSHPEDCTLPFFEKYGNAKRINVYEDWKTEDFTLELVPKITVPDNLFVNYTPEYISETLLETT